jgi:4-amino-4-deoxychorismate lyase
VTTLINGVPCETISVHDRGLLYGDGVFRTVLLRHGKLQQWARHYAKLYKDCNTIGLLCPEEQVLLGELSGITQNISDGIVKVIVTRGTSQRGYAPTNRSSATHVVTLSTSPSYPESYARLGVRLHLCQLRLGHQPRLAGIKHLNRLENVLAAAECNDSDIAEGLLLDESGYVIEGVRSNIFMLKAGELLTPDLSQCGVSGVQRERVFDWAAQHKMPCRSSKIRLQELLQADEIFLVNSIIGLWPVREMQDYHCEHHPIALTIQDWLNHESD